MISIYIQNVNKNTIFALTLLMIMGGGGVIQLFLLFRCLTNDTTISACMLSEPPILTHMARCEAFLCIISFNTGHGSIKFSQIKYY
jgi:hypothetical protein